MADIKIAGTLHNSEDIQGDPLHSHVVARADEILDEAKGKKQSLFNQQTDTKLDTHETRLNGYTQGKFVTVETYAELEEQTPATDTIYRVSNYDGSANSGAGAVDVTKYSEYAWRPTGENTGEFIFLCVKTQIGEVFDISEYNNDTYDDLADALSNDHVPVGVRRGGMSVKFVHTSDNKYVQYRLMADEFTTDTTQWAFCDDSVYVENPEFIKVITDKENRILIAIEKNGNVLFGVGVPQQIVDYIREKIEELSLDEYEDIVDFLNGIEEGDKTLAELLNEKVNKVEGKSLIDENYAAQKSAIENLEYLELTLDSEDKILEARKADGTKIIDGGVELKGGVSIEGTIDHEGVTDYFVENSEFIAVYLDKEDRILAAIKRDGDIVFGIGVPTQIKDYISDVISLKVDKEEGKGLSSNDYTDDEKEIVNTQKLVESPEYIYIETDANDSILGGREKDGAKFENMPIKTPAATVESIDDPEERHEIKLDSKESIISYRDKNGVLHENVGIVSDNVTTKETISESVEAKNAAIENAAIENVDIHGGSAHFENLTLSNEALTELEQALIQHGFYIKAPIDWSDAKSVEIDEPRCAILNLITDVDLTTLSKKSRVEGEEGVNYDIPMQVQFWDMKGNYFKKWILCSGQGNSSMAYDKRNMAFDFFNGNPNDPDFDEDDTFSIKIGDWISMDSYHMKSFYTEYFRGSAMIAYKVAEKIERNRGIYEDKPWKKSLIDMNAISDSIATNPMIDDISLQIDNGALCHPDGFPCIVYQNGSFWGIFSFNIKKHRGNYHMVKNNPSHIHLDGYLYYYNIFNTANGPVWSAFEIRNPKKLVYAADVIPMFDSTQNYASGAVVSDINRKNVYKSRRATSGQTLDNTTYWRKISDSPYKYDADVIQGEIAGNSDGSATYVTWAAGSYNIGDIVIHNGHKFMNTVADNTAEPVYHSKNNADDAPDFKNKTGCGWLNVTNTIKVKEAIIALSTRCPAIVAASGTDAKKALFETYFDVDNLVDYELTQMITGDTDSVGKNWQWITYDGIKWWCTEYDKDQAFGNNWTGMYTIPASDNGGWIQRSSSDPIGILINLYSQKIKTDGINILNNVATADYIKGLFIDWINRIGQDNFDKEWKKWPESPCNRDPKIDEEHWQRTDTVAIANWSSTSTYSSGVRVVVNNKTFRSVQNSNIGHDPLVDDGTWWLDETYDATKTYVPTSETAEDTYCFMGTDNRCTMFTCKAESTGNPPITGTYTKKPIMLGYIDSFWRVARYIDARHDVNTSFLNSL